MTKDLSKKVADLSPGASYVRNENYTENSAMEANRDARTAPLLRSIPAMLEMAAERDPEKVHLRIGSRQITFAECRDRVAGMAGRLMAAGIEPGDRVAIMCRNRLEFIDFFAGCLWLGVIAVPLNTALRGGQLTHALTLSSARLLILDEELVEHLALLPQLRTLRATWTVSPSGDLSSAVPLPGTPPPRRETAPGDPAAILFTSGTTGPSKGAICPAAQFYWWAKLQTEAMGVSRDSVIFNALPLFHINALNSFVQSLLTGATCVIAERFSASRFWSTAAEEGATHSALIGAMANILLAQPPGPQDQAHSIGTVLASSVRADTWSIFSERFNVRRRVGGYGSTETNLVFNTETGWRMQGNMGHVVKGFEAAVVDEHDTVQIDGVAGELVVRSNLPFAFALGYWNMPEETVRSWRNLWFHTGDRVTRDSDGRFRFVGRLKESIRRRGENISAWEVEQALLGHDAVAEAAVFGIKSDVADEEVMAAIILKEGTGATPEDIFRFLEPRLAYFAIPRYVEFMSALPLTDTGKLRRGQLQERGVTSATWDRESAGFRLKRDRR